MKTSSDQNTLAQVIMKLAHESSGSVRLFTSLGVALAATLFLGQTGSQPLPALQKIEVQVERKRAGRVEMMEPIHVFEAGDLVRFRFKSNFSGSLHVTNHATSGQYTILFPSRQTGTNDRVEKDRSYFVPVSEDGWFRVSGPAGYEEIYWVVTPTEQVGTANAVPQEAVSLKPAATNVDATESQPAPSPLPAQTLTPRCDDALFRARGDCVDSSAGPRTVRDAADLPTGVGGAKNGSLGLKPRDVTVSQAGRKTTFLSPLTGVSGGPGDVETPFVYVFRLAHK